MAVGFPTKANWAAGDVLTASAQDDLAGTVNLLSNASAASGSQLVSNVAGTSFAYQATPSASNPVLNSGFNVWQRSTSAAMGGAGAYTSADRWATYAAPTLAVMSRQVTGDTTNLPNIQYCARLTHTAGDTTTGTLNIGNSFETINSIPFAGKTVTLSFYARAGATAVSSSQNVLVGRIQTGTGTDQNLESTGYTGAAIPVTTSSTLTTTWQRFTTSGTIASTATEMGVEFRWNTTATAGATDYVEITGVQIDIGSVALPFRTYAATYQAELAACQRYYWRNTPGVAFGIHGNLTFNNSTATEVSLIKLPVVMRTIPNGTIDYSSLRVQQPGVAQLGTISALAYASETNVNNVLLQVTITGGTYLAANPYQLLNDNSTSGYLGFSAEL
jgi:hypothetical protein